MLDNVGAILDGLTVPVENHLSPSSSLVFIDSNLFCWCFFGQVYSKIQ